MRTIAVAALAIGVLSCGPAADDIVASYGGESQEQRLSTMRTAPVIVVGTVKTVKTVGLPRPATRPNGDLSLQLYEAAIEVELIVRGKVGERIRFSFFGPNPNGGLLGQPKFYLREGERRLFFLKSENRRYRAVGDYLDYSEPVYTGKPDLELVQRDDSDKDIARVLLTPSRFAYDESLFAATLFQSAGTARSFVPSTVVQDLLEGLTTHANKDVRTQACNNLAVHHKRSKVCSSY